ncbi:MAG: DUF1648 domain-containing protein [Anaerolineae bacterium]|nr:DUF1648 domain-containing protein [Anaerolineae bacterium]MDW8099313.1 DUF1648 domain-containing protein [Anaerolineae bacterium]
MSFDPLPCPQTRQALALCGVLLLLAVGLLGSAFVLPFGGGSFALAMLAMGTITASAYLLYRTWMCMTLAYWIDRDGVTVVWWFARYVIPMTHIRQIVLGAADRGPGPWWTWPSRYIAVLDGGIYASVISFSTRPLPEQLLLVTPNGVVGLSPADPQGFLAALQERFRLGPARQLTPGWRLPRVASSSMWRDRLGLSLLALGLLGTLVLFGWLSIAYPGLPEQIPLHYDIQGMPDRIGPRAGLFVLPMIALLTWLVNGIWGGWFYARQPAGAYLLWSGTLIVQILAGIALGNLMSP